MLNARLDATSAVLTSRLMDFILEPYGISAPEKFLQFVDKRMATIRFTDDDSAVAIAKVTDEARIREFIVAGNGRKKVVGDDVTLYSSTSEEKSAAFIDGFLLLGSEGSIMRCIEARKSGSSLVTQQSFVNFMQSTTDKSANAISVWSENSKWRERDGEHRFVRKIGSDLHLGDYSVSRTRLTLNGFARNTTSNFGLLGMIANQFATSEK